MEPNEMNTHNQTAIPEEQPTMEAKSESSTGSAIGIIIVVALLILGGFYFLSGKFGADTNDGTPPALVEQTDNSADEFDSVNDGETPNDQEFNDELDAIDAEAETELELEA